MTTDHNSIQLHKFLLKEAAAKVLKAIKAADKRDKLGYQVCILELGERAESIPMNLHRQLVLHAIQTSLGLTPV